MMSKKQLLKGTNENQHEYLVISDTQCYFVEEVGPELFGHTLATVVKNVNLQPENYFPALEKDEVTGGSLTFPPVITSSSSTVDSF